MGEKIKLTVDGRRVEVDAGVTLYEVIKKLGVQIPTLCFVNDGCGEGGSCMVCAVMDNSRSTLIPACSALALEGMDIVSSSEYLDDFRRRTLEMLLAEHVGDCSGPCDLACPANIDLSQMLHLCAAGKFEKAAELIGENFPCEECPSRCEKACRRERHDKSVSIRETVRFLVTTYGTQRKSKDSKKAYQHRFGKVDDENMQQFLLETDFSPRNELSEVTESAPYKLEATRCLHCDCRAKDSCSLRELATALDAKQNRFRLDQKKTFTKVFTDKLIFEQGKCIKCARCVDKAREQGREVAPIFADRGFELKISHPLGHDWHETVVGLETDLAGVCPTGAFVLKGDNG